MDVAKFTEIVFALLDETFENHHGIYTDEGESLLKTLDTRTAEEASAPVGGVGATLAAHVAHVTRYIDVLEADMRGLGGGEMDWDDIWNRVKAVTPGEWDGLKRVLKQSYDRVVATGRSFDENWEPEEHLWVLGIITHTAYHLGAIRQPVCLLPSGAPSK